MKTLITAILFAVSFATAAHNQVSRNDVHDLPVTTIKVFYSQPGEERAAFVKRVAPEFAAYTEQTGHEACGEIGVLKNGADGVNPTFSITMGTIGSQIACKTDFVVADGYMPMYTSVHSHPQKRNVRLTATDMKARGTPAGKLRVEMLKPCEFSQPDYDESGFLVTCGKVLYQTGLGTSKEI